MANDALLSQPATVLSHPGPRTRRARDYEKFNIIIGINVKKGEPKAPLFGLAATLCVSVAPRR